MVDFLKLLGVGGDWNSRREYVERTVWQAVCNAETMETVLKGGLRKLFEAALPKSVAADFCAIVMRFGEYTYDPSTYRRSYRSLAPKDYYTKLLIMANEIFFDWEGFDLLTYLNMTDAQKQEKNYKSPGEWIKSMLIALKIDQNDKGIIDAVTDIILSENNTRAVSHGLIRGIAMSHHQGLYELVIKLLLAAKLQEGLRQLILESADDGVLDYLKLVIKTVLENDLLRFSSALRAVCVWMGLNYEYSDKRVVEKLLNLGYGFLQDEGERKAAIGSTDMTRMYAAMWAESAYAVQNLNPHIERYMRGEKYQKMTGAYFLRETGSFETRIRLAGEAMNNDENDMDILTLILENYSLKFYNVSDNHWGYNYDEEDKQNIINTDKYPECLKNASVRDRHFSRLVGVFGKIPKDGHNVKGKPFDWCDFTLTRDAVFETMMVLAVYDFDKPKQQQLRELFPLVESQNKIAFLDYFLSRKIKDWKREFLFDCLSDKITPVRLKAVKLVKKITVTEPELIKVEGLLALKTGEIRQTVLELIRNTGDALPSVKRLIADKNENKRLAALDLLSSMKKSGAIDGSAIAELLTAMPRPTEAETILINNLRDSEATEYSEENGFGLYDPGYTPVFPPVERDKEYTLQMFKKISARDMTKLLDSLLDLIEKHKDHEFKAVYRYGNAEDCIFGNANFLQIVKIRNDDEEAQIEDYVLGEVWKSWFNTHSENLLTCIKIIYCYEVSNYGGDYDPEYWPFARDIIKKLLGFDEIKEFVGKSKSKKFYSLAIIIIRELISLAADKREKFKTSCGILSDLFLSVPREDWCKPCDKNTRYYYRQDTKLADLKEVSFFRKYLNAGNDEEYIKKLALCYAIGQASDSRYIALFLGDVAYAVANGLAEKGELCRAVMEIDGPNTIRNYTEKLHRYEKKTVSKYPILLECVNDVVKRVIEIELKRGDTKTQVSHLAQAVSRHEGAEVFAEILAALGKETLTRGYVWGSDHTKREVLSSLLKASVPADGDNAETLRAALCGRVPEKRLLEAVMYAPAWIAIAEDYLDWPGLKCAAWYFHAHTRNSYSPEFETEVARFSPIDKEDFQRGAFDINWFKEAYACLGEERFNTLYDCAKYISDGSNHRCAQLFADAVLGKLNIDETETRIRDKRNKDLLLSYSLIPFSENPIREALRRFEFIHEFLKKSREFGSQRQASEKEAVNISLENLARNLGYADILRFNWKMEMEKLDVIQNYFKPRPVGDTSLFLEMDDSGLAGLVVDKGGKRLNSIPASIKKDEYVKEISGVKASLKAQFSRARLSLEKAMENRDTFSFGEAAELLGHPVISPLIKKLVFRSGEELVFLSDTGLRRVDSTETVLDEGAALTIAHCYDLFCLGKWLDYQRYAFDNSLVQPFKQIFRELYLVNEDEKSEKIISRRYAGHQIQPKKTVALLKGRGWTVDYESGLQKVYYKENVVASMYALADWFSPADVEAPTLETVRFFERKTGKPLEFEKINPVLFSEVMRDVDLVVSVAHVGGVDPMASHSTVEMRSVIVAESLRLMKLNNVTISGSHAKIRGTLGEYSVHFGSGIAQMMGRGALNILPVHSQHRGRLFLPFMDEDPKTAEIVSKVLLLAEDDKIKDPTVRMQIQ